MSNNSDPDQARRLIWVQRVCKIDQLTRTSSLAGKKLGVLMYPPPSTHAKGFDCRLLSVGYRGMKSNMGNRKSISYCRKL